MGDDRGVTSVIPPNSRLVMAHGAGSSSDFLRSAFPPEAVGVAECVMVDDRTGNLAHVMNRIAAMATPDRPTVLGGVSLGAHAAAALLARGDLPEHVVGGLLVMPAWTGEPGPTADMTAAAAAALESLGPSEVLAHLDPDDWVTPLLASAWAQRSPDDLVAELRRASQSPGPTEQQLRDIQVPVAIVALRDDPLHPQSVATSWAALIPQAEVVVLDRAEPTNLAAFARAAARAFGALSDQTAVSSSSSSSPSST